MTTIVLAGASGFMGRHLNQAFRRDGAIVRTIGRSAAADDRWDADLTGCSRARMCCSTSPGGR